MMVSTALRMLATIVSKVENREGQGWEHVIFHVMHVNTQFMCCLYTLVCEGMEMPESVRAMVKGYVGISNREGDGEHSMSELLLFVDFSLRVHNHLFRCLSSLGRDAYSKEEERVLRVCMRALVTGATQFKADEGLTVRFLKTLGLCCT